MVEGLQRRSALQPVYAPGEYGAQTPAPGITLSQRTGLAIIQVAAYADSAERALAVIAQLTGLAPASEHCRAVERNGVGVLWAGPQRWWIVEPEQRDRVGELQTRLGDAAAVSDHSHGRVVLRLGGPALRALLAKGSTIDFHVSRFGAGWCRPVMLGHYHVLLHCLDGGAAATADVYVMRSFAVSFWQWLTDAAGEFGYQVAPGEFSP